MGLNNKHITYTATDIANYLSGKLSAQEMHAIEKQALQDPFLADAIEGFADANSTTTTQHLANIHKAFAHKKTNETTENLSVQSSNKKNNNRIWISVAACIGIIITSIAIFYKTKTTKYTNEIANITTITNDASKSKSASKEDNSNLAKGKNETSEAKNITTSENAVASTKNTISEEILTKNNTSNNNLSTEEKLLYNNDFNAEKLDDKKAMADTDKIRNENTSEKNKETAKDNQAKQTTENQIPNYNANNFLNNKSQNISGRIVNEANQPVPFASVQVNNSRQITTTNNEGYFNIKPNTLSDTSLLVKVNAIGYQNQVVNISNQTSNNIIKLENDNNNLNEVVVTGYNAAKKRAVATTNADAIEKPKIDSALVPIGGWPAFYKYIENNGTFTRSKVDTSIAEFKTTYTFTPSQEVVLSFKIDDDGTPIKIKVEQSQSKEASNKAIELLKNGPKWKNTNKKNQNKVAIKLN